MNIKKGSWFDFTQTPVNGEIWFPAEFTAHVDGRFLLVKGFNGDARDTFSDYRKMRTSVTILPGTQILDDADTPENASPSAASSPTEPPPATPPLQP